MSRPPLELSKQLGALLDNVDAEHKEFLSLGQFDERTVENLRLAFEPERISDTLNIEGIAANPRITIAVMKGELLASELDYVAIEIQRMFEAQKVVQELSGGGDLEVADILRLNREIRGSETPGAGVIRLTDVAITGAQVRPPGADEVSKELDHLVAYANSNDGCHPIAGAAWLHHGVARIHPFLDGNGRTARLCQDLVLIKNNYLPVGIPAFRRQEYYDALHQADFGDLEPLIALVANSQLTTLTKARRVVLGPTRRAKVVRAIAQGRQKGNDRAFEAKFEHWKRMSDAIALEAQQWAEELATESEEAKIMRVKLWDPLPIETWKEIDSVGYSRNSWLMTLFFGAARQTQFSILLSAKRLDKIPALRSGLDQDLPTAVGIQVVCADVQQRYDFTNPDYNYVKMVGIDISNEGFGMFLWNDGQITRTRSDVGDVLESLITDAAIKAGWTPQFPDESS